MKRYLFIPMTRSPARRTRGSSMVEMVLVLPIFFFLLSMLFFFGKGVVRVQRVTMLDRYEVWRTSAHPYLVEVTEEWQLNDRTWQYGNEQPLGPTYQDQQDEPQLNETFLNGRAESIAQTDGYLRDRGAGGAVDELFDALAANPDASEYGQTLYQYHPHHISRSYQVIYPEESVPLWQRFEGDINHSSGRHNHDWRIVNGHRILIINRSDISRWGYDNVEIVNGTNLRLDNFGLTNIAVERIITADQVVDRGDHIELWRRRWPWSGNWGAMRDMYLTDMDERLRAMDPNAITNDEVYAGALVRWYTDFYRYSGPTVYRR